MKSDRLFTGGAGGGFHVPIFFKIRCTVAHVNSKNEKSIICQKKDFRLQSPDCFLVGLPEGQKKTF